jgi:hypothetical protein
MDLPVLVPVEYRGELVALVSRERIHIISPWLLDRPVGDPDLRFVAFMCACCGEVLNGAYRDRSRANWRRRGRVSR